MTIKLTDLRDDIDAVVIDLRRERNDGEIPLDEAIVRVRSKLADRITHTADQLIDLALRKLIHDVSGRKRLSLALAGQTNLFGRYSGVPAMITTGKGKKRDTTKATFQEADNWLSARENKDIDVRSKNDKFKQMVEELRPYLRSPTDTLEEAARRKFEAESPRQGDLLVVK
ncbi:hypothetical protein [Pseudochrobactrum asaccharolyticum]|uniref:Uncharacterized protein n=1 Tax=Pseudochrobactrum asaccharolyticum TaxID=354351 RepID=A0A366E4F6_9HYPH|nr:hypothetical protein [Pseudochrobactrum asaccharolyticum]MBX8802033.1 hypothetical protein [Ochrobactrum sp. MR28]MBX8817684.1 hypothetical protein [Ochrobactrum sp. MR31]RBO97256.1 hypothetical protein DFR47_10237 [Pseudochrobactrum asaccharolyticum]